MKKIILLIFISLAFYSSKAQGVFMLTTGTVAPASSAIFNFSTPGSVQTGCTNWTGDPTTSITITDATTGWSLASIPSHWMKYGGTAYGGVGNGATMASTDGTFTQAMINSSYFNISDSVANYQLQFTNLPAGTYAIYMLGGVPTSIYDNSGNTRFLVQFGTATVNYNDFDPNGKPGTTGNLVTSGPGSVTSGTFTGSITSGQTIQIGIAKTGSGQFGWVNAIKIVKTS